MDRIVSETTRKSGEIQKKSGSTQRIQKSPCVLLFSALGHLGKKTESVETWTVRTEHVIDGQAGRAAAGFRCGRRLRRKRFAQIGIALLCMMLAVGTAASGGMRNGERVYAVEMPDIAAAADDAGAVMTAENTAGSSPQLSLTAPSVVLMELSTGTIIYSTDPDTRRSPASITKIMTLILIFEALEAGKIHLEDTVSTSAYASSMGGSQVFLEEGEIQTVDTMLKCIVMSSANDASVAMAEYLAGSESEFVRQMNEKAAQLGMENTHFEDCCGLTDSDSHYTTARDVAIMSRELMWKHPDIRKYTTVWMDTITHNTRKGSSEFGLSSTNKLLKMSNSFQTTGLKTGSTSKAKYCLSATAEKDGIQLAAVIMACPNYKDRFSEAAALLNYGYANCSLYIDEDAIPEEQVPVKNGVTDSVIGVRRDSFSYLGTKGEQFADVERTICYYDDLQAPIAEGDIIGYLSYLLNGTELGTMDILAAESVEKAKFGDYMRKMLQHWLL